MAGEIAGAKGSGSYFIQSVRRGTNLTSTSASVTIFLFSSLCIHYTRFCFQTSNMEGGQRTASGLIGKHIRIFLTLSSTSIQMEEQGKRIHTTTLQSQ